MFKGHFIFQPSIFEGYISFQGGKGEFTNGIHTCSKCGSFSIAKSIGGNKGSYWEDNIQQITVMNYIVVYIPSLELTAKAPKNGWLEYEGFGLFAGANWLLVSGR